VSLPPKNDHTYLRNIKNKPNREKQTEEYVSPTAAKHIENKPNREKQTEEYVSRITHCGKTL
jgi:hypothetical protein